MPASCWLAFRHAGKSTLLALWCGWLLARRPAARILVLSADQALATRMVRHVRRVVERHPLTAALRPKRPEEWAADRFTVEGGGSGRDPSLLARGILGNVTGSHADIVVCDDVEVPATAATPQRRADLRRRLSEIEFVLAPDGIRLFAGTPHSWYSIYAAEARAEADETRPFLHGFDRLEVPLVDEAGRLAWPERFPAEAVAAIAERSGPAAFASQMLLQPRSPADGRLDPDLLVAYEAELEAVEAAGALRLSIGGRRMVAASGWWDPSYGAPRAGDASVVAAVFIDEAGDYWLHGLEYLTHDPALLGEVDAATQQCRAVARFAEAHHLPALRLEANGIGAFLPGLLRRALAEAGIGTVVTPVSNSTPKAARILATLDAVLAAGRLHAHARVLRTPFVAEMREWRPERSARDDGLDAVAGAIASEPVRLPFAPRPRRREWRPAALPHLAETRFRP